MRFVHVFIASAFVLLGVRSVQAQAPTRVECGTVIDGQFTDNMQFQDYSIDMNPGDKLQVSGSPLGDNLSFSIALFDPTGVRINISDNGGLSKSPSFESGILSAPGTYVISPANAQYTVVNTLDYRTFYNSTGRWGGIGVYTLYIGCTLSDGTVITPGEKTPEQAQISLTAAPTMDPNFVGFPGLDPVSFANAFKLPLTLGTSTPGQIPPTGDALLGLTFDGNAGDTFALDFAKQSGNLNLGIVILSANNEVVFQASLVTSDSLSTRMMLPTTGQYTIGVFRIDLLPPANPEATAFQITGTLNP